MGLLPLVLLGCVSEATDSSDSGEDEAPREPEWGVAEVQDFLDRRLAEARPEPAVMAPPYVDLLSHAEHPCPSMAEPGNHWGPWATGPTACTTSAGWRFYGQAVMAAGCDTTVFDVGGLVSFEVAGPAGEVARAGGTFQIGCSRVVDEGECFGQLAGSFQFTAGGPVLTEGYVASIFYEETWAGGETVTVLDGGITWPDGTMALRELTFSGAGAAGALAVRDPSAVWFSLAVPEAGEGCVPLTVGDADVGEVCVDLTGWSAPLERIDPGCAD